MTFEPYHCTFVGDTTGFSVNPAEGTLERRGGEATLLDVQYLGKVSRSKGRGNGGEDTTACRSGECFRM